MFSITSLMSLSHFSLFGFCKSIEKDFKTKTFFAVQVYLKVNNKGEGHPSQDSSIGSISALYRGGTRFQSRQGREFFSENK